VVGAVTPFAGRSRSRRLLKLVLRLLGVVVVPAICQLLGLDVVGWFVSVWDTMSAESAQNGSEAQSRRAPRS
jgi:hypothetical protein